MNKDLEHRLGHTFENPRLLQQALTHPSLAGGKGMRKDSNQRMEFLGDRVLGLIIAEMLYQAYPDEEEGAMARRHTAMVRREALARVASEIGLAGHVNMAPSEQDTGGRQNPALLADACEAVIAAIYLDGGIAPAGQFIRRYWAPLMAEIAVPPLDAKTALQEYAQSQGLALPSYQEICRSGPAHDPVFTMAVTIEGSDPVSATGGSKRVAEQATAALLLDTLRQQK